MTTIEKLQEELKTLEARKEELTKASFDLKIQEKILTKQIKTVQEGIKAIKTPDTAK